MERDVRNPTVFVIDDDETVQRSMRWLFESVGLHVETFGSAREFLDEYDPDGPGCAVLDVRMPGMSGLDLLDNLAEEGVRLPVIVLTGHADVQIAVRAMHSGAVDVVEKPASDQKLVEKVQQAIARDRREHERRARHREVLARIEELTPREVEVLRQVVRGDTSRQIAESLDVSSKTVEAHRGKIMGKLGARNVSHLISLVHPVLDDLGPDD